MPKSKYAPVLFEVIRSRQETRPGCGLPLPRWWRSAPGAAQGQETSAPVGSPRACEPQAGAEPESPAVRSAEAVAEPVGAAGAGDEASRPTAVDGETVWTRPWRIRGNRLEIRLQPMVFVVVVGALLVSWLVAYQLGRGARPAPGAATGGGQEVVSDPIQEAMLRPPDPTVLNVTGPPRSRERVAAEPRATVDSKTPPGQAGGEAGARAGVVPAAGEPAAQRVEPGGANLNRVLIQVFAPNHKAAAEHVQRWLEANYSVRTELIRKGKGDWWLATTDGFDFNHPGDKELCEKFINDIKSLGRECGRELARAGLPVYTLTGPYAFR